MSEPVRLSKRLIELTQCSRREAELYIEGGWVTVDGVVIEEPQAKVTDERVELHPDAVAEPGEPVTLLVNVPADQPLDATLAALDRASRWPDDASGVRPLRGHLHRLTLSLPLPAGASGQQILSQDWRVERKLKDDGDRLEQEFVIEVSGDIIADGLALLNQENYTYKGVTRSPIKASWQNETRLRFALKNPPSGLIQSMCKAVGLRVVSIKRIRVGGVPMSKLQPGQWRYLAAREKF
jgi:23S rRNA pseudouridine2604 synthase